MSRSTGKLPPECTLNYFKVHRWLKNIS